MVEVYSPAMYCVYLVIVIGYGTSARSVRIDLPPFTLIGATTRSGLLSAPLRDRFGVLSRLEYYEHKDLCQIVERTSRSEERRVGKDIRASRWRCERKNTDLV